MNPAEQATVINEQQLQETDGFVYRECHGEDLEQLTEQGWKLVTIKESARSFLDPNRSGFYSLPLHGRSYLLRRPRIKPTEMELRDKVALLEAELAGNKKTLELLANQVKLAIGYLTDLPVIAPAKRTIAQQRDLYEARMRKLQDMVYHARGELTRYDFRLPPRKG